MKIISVVGTRPNFVKISPLVLELKKHKEIEHILVHTGQHYDKEMSKLLFDDLNIPKSDVNLGVGPLSDIDQTAKILQELGNLLKLEKPDIVIVVGDVNSTFAAALCAKKSKIKIAHVESGLRSFDETMPEEINRILTDHISDFLFTTEKSANKNLTNEGIKNEKVFFVGNVMIDSLLLHKEKALQSKILSQLKISKEKYGALTLHRPSNVDTKKSLEYTLNLLDQIQKNLKIVFPIHPRTRKNIEAFGFNQRISKMKNVVLTDPLGYLDFLCLMSNAKVVLTDSGGMQEETTVLGVPCITIRNNTERPVTVEQGTNLLVSTNTKEIVKTLNSLDKAKKKTKIPELWDGKAAKRIVEILIKKH